jgi:intracellular sulfur oxidation DsrE/DsrF family protein
MPENLKKIVLFSFCLICAVNFAQQPVTGKVIHEFGPTYRVENPDIPTSISEDYKVVFDIAKAPEDPSQINKYVEGVARFLNMHVEAGKPLNTIDVAVVIHGEAAHGLLKNEYYKEIYSVDNPNLELFKALHQNGVRLILCGQTAAHRNIGEERRIRETKIALSAMTALIQLQNDNYRLISF